jgi:3-hydroxyacyl-[acyl-carrier-protein] dehydratase
MSLERSLCFDHRHPALPGHFPGDPLIPGVLILDEVEQTLASNLGPGHISALPAVKFLSPLRPGETLTIRIEPVRPGQYRFGCACGERMVAQGQLAWEPA